MKKLFLFFTLTLFTQFLSAQAIYGVFGLPPTTNLGEKQIGTINSTNGDITLLGANTSIEDGRIDMTTGATALNVTDNKSYFIGEDNSDDPSIVDRIYTVDLLTGTTDTSPQLTAGYSTSNNYGIWFDDIDDVLYGLFLIGGTTAELASINPTTGAVSTVIADVVGEDVESLASGLMTGGRDNTNGSDAKRIFVFINDSLFAINLDDVTSIMIEVGGSNFASSRTFGLEWDNINNALWVLYNPDLGERNLAKVVSEDEFTEEAFVDSDFGVDGFNQITTASGLSALDEQSGLFFFIGRPTVGANNGKWSLYSVDVIASTSSNVDIEDAALVQTNGYAGIEVLPGPDLTFSKTDGDSLDTEPGDTITYTLNYSNDANAGATNGLSITETVPAETTFNNAGSTSGWVCADVIAGSSCVFTPTELPPGGSGSVDFAVTVDAMVSPALNQIDNTASISATNLVNDLMANDSTPITASAILDVSKTDNDLTDAIPGDTIAYEIAATNTGNRVASNAVLTETVPDNTTYVPTMPFVWNCAPTNEAGSTCTTNAADLDENAVATTFHVQVIGSVPAGTTEISNTITLSADNAASDQAIDTTPITSAATLTLNKTDGDTSVIPGDSVVYQIEYGNSGNQDAADTIIFETIPNGTTFDAFLSSPSWACSGTGAFDTCSLNVGTLSGGDSSTVDFAVTAFSPASVIMEEIENTARIEASNAMTQFAIDTTPLIADASLRIVKTDGGVTAGLDKIISYALIFFNDGNQDAEGIILTETVPDHTTFYPPASTNGWSCLPDNSAGSTCTYSSLFLGGNGGKDTVFFAVKTPQQFDQGVTSITNTVDISALSTSSTDQDSVTTEVDGIAPILNSVTANPDFVMLPSCSQNSVNISELTAFLEDENFSGLIGADDPSNYLLINTGNDNELQTTNCDIVMGDDQMINIDSFSYNAGSPISFANFTLETPLTNGQYVLKICDNITDAAGNQFDGDQDGLEGGVANHQFRVDLDNFFNNAYLDDCADNPVSLNNWNALAVLPDVIETVTETDIDDSSLSGSMSLQSNSNASLGVEQCVNFDAFGSHTMSVNSLGLASQQGDVEMNFLCAFRDDVNCAGSINGIYTDSFTLPASNTPMWENTNGRMVLPDGTLSASCSVLLDSPDDNSFEYYLDEFSIIDSDLIFKNGFESK